MAAVNPAKKPQAPHVGDMDSLYTVFNHITPRLGPDGTPFEYYEALRDEALTAPVGRSEEFGGFWVVAGYDECRDVMRRPKEFSNQAVIWPAYNTGEDKPLMVAGQDEPEHKMYRGLVQSKFSPSAADEYYSVLREMTNELIDSFIGDGQVDISDVIADEIPARLTAYFLGLNQHESATYRSWIDVMAHGIPGADSTNKVLGEMHAYFADTVERTKRAPGDDILSHLTQVEIDGAPLSDEDLISFCIVLLLGGIHNSAKLLSNAFWRLGWDVELRRRVIANPKMIPALVEEFLRYYTPAPLGRLVIADKASVAGVTMQRGDIVVLALPVADRDPRQFEHPDAFIPERNPNRHLGLGHGMHACLGGSLIRVEARVVLEEFLQRIPEFALDTSEKTPRWQHGQTSGMTDVVLRFPPPA